MMKRVVYLVLAALGSALVLVPTALGHVTVNPNEAAAGSFSRFAVRVPTERDADTTEVSMQLPEGLFFVSFQPKDGWTREVKMETLDPPVELFGNEYTERVAEVTWSGGKIGPGEFDEFGMSARMPDAEAGTELVFPAVQTYSTGEVVRWIGEADAETPAPRVTVLAAPEEGEEAASGESDDSNTIEYVALGVGIVALVAALAALGVGLRRKPA
jgi:uncharacterized protein YcnI